MKNKIIIFSAPSGSGKSTVVHYLLKKYPELEFSISATSRAPRGKEKNGKDYYFYSTRKFKELISQKAFVEYEEVYEDSFYGTLRSELNRIWEKGHTIVFDIDVKGGKNLKKLFGNKALAVFVKTPSIEILRQRLIDRGTDSKEAIETRIAKASEELTYEKSFDYVLVNDDLDKTLKEADDLIGSFLQ
ncbi:MAG: guanylate kinase [Bacteroidales bacterium]